MPPYPLRTSPGQDLRDLFGAERLRAQSRHRGVPSITQGEGSLELLLPGGLATGSRLRDLAGPPPRISTVDDLAAAYALVGVSNVTALLTHLYESRALQGSVLRHAVARAWVIAEHPELELPRAQWIAWFRKIGFTRDAESAEPPVLPLALYRGADPSHAHNMAWTTDPHLASWFARRHEPQIRGRIYRAIVAPDALLAHLTGTVSRDGESEWVIDPAGILSFGTHDEAGATGDSAELVARAKLREW